MIDIPKALRAVAPTLGRRLSGKGRLNLRTDLDDAALAWSGGKARVEKPGRGESVRLSQAALAQLLYGYRSVPALAGRGEIKGSKKALGALAEAFPTEPFFNYDVDHF